MGLNAQWLCDLGHYGRQNDGFLKNPFLVISHNKNIISIHYLLASQAPHLTDVESKLLEVDQFAKVTQNRRRGTGTGIHIFLALTPVLIL